MHTARLWSLGKYVHRAAVVALALCAAACAPDPLPGGLVGSGGLVDTEEIGRQIDRTITNISTDVTRWTAELDGLVRYLVDQKFMEAATFVRDSLDDGIARVGVEFRCDVDFTAQRVRQGLKALKDAILSLGRDTTSTATFPPFVCQATPWNIKWIEAPQAISLTGYDFRPTGITVTIVGRTGQTSDITAALTVPSPYQLTLNLSGAGAAFPRDCARVELRAQGSVISTLSCLTDCPAAQPPDIIPADSKIVVDDTYRCGGKIGGNRCDRDVGTACPDGYFRVEPFEVSFVDGGGPTSGNCGEGDQHGSDQFTSHWQSSNLADCSIHEHIGVTDNSFWTCHYIVTALRPMQVIYHDPPQVGWCPYDH